MFVENYKEDGGERYFLEVDVCYPDKLQFITFILKNYGLCNDLSILPKIMKIWKVGKLLAN